MEAFLPGPRARPERYRGAVEQPHARRTRTMTTSQKKPAMGTGRALLVLGIIALAIVVLIGIVFPGQWALTDRVSGVLAPEGWLGAGRWLVPVLIFWTMTYLGPPVRPGWGATLLGDTIAFIGLLGVVALIADAGHLSGLSGGRIGTFVAESLAFAISEPAAFIACVAAVIVGVRIASAPHGG